MNIRKDGYVEAEQLRAPQDILLKPSIFLTQKAVKYHQNRNCCMYLLSTSSS
jgi:hypothetical protein